MSAKSVLQAAITAIDWNEIIYILVGAVIGFLGSILVLGFERLLDKKGTIQIFYRKILQRGMNGRGWGFCRSEDGRLYFTIPIAFEIQNTTNTTRVIRDVSLLLYAGNRFVAKMYQSSGKHVKTHSGPLVTGTQDFTFGAEKGSYSFVLPPRSIQKQECEYSYIIYPGQQEEKAFDTIIARYYDERNKPHTFKVMSVENAWTPKLYDADEDWCVLEEKLSLP